MSRLPALSLRSLLLGLGLAASLLPAQAADVGQITWLAGYRVREAGGGDEEARRVSRLMQFVAEGWPEIRYATMQANPRRAWQLIAQGEHVCQTSSVRTPEREKLAYFTETLIGPPMQVIVRRDRLREVPRNAAGEVDLARLLAERRLRGALVDGRSYGSFIDAILVAPGAASSPVLTRYASNDFGSQIVSMLSLGRADFTIRQESISGPEPGLPEAALSQLASMPIAGASALVRAGIACPRTPWGLAAVQGIDRALGTPAGAALLRELSLQGFNAEDRRRYGAQFEAFYRERAKPSVIR